MKKMLRNITMFLVVANLGLACNGQVKPVKKKEQAKAGHAIVAKQAIPEEWLEIEENYGFLIAMPYADTANFTHKRIYGCAKCLLRPEAGQALIVANALAASEGLKIVIYDCYRPRPYQQKMYDVVPDKRYVADPAKGSMHNRGCAVDVGLADSKNNLLDMGTGFDDFSEKAAYTFKGLTAEQLKNRTLLRKLMTEAGFRPYEKEWWHFNYKKNDYPLSDYIWPCN